MNAELPKISVVTVTYNCASCLEPTLRSIFAQDYPSVESILIDGGSTDGTVALIEKWAGRIDYWTSEPDKGIFDAMNKGLSVATGEWVCFMNAGDTFADSRVLSAVFSGGGPIGDSVACVYGQTWALFPGRKVLDPNEPFYRNPSFFRPMGFCHQAVFVRLQWARRVGFDLSYKIASDYRMLRTIYDQGGGFREVPVAVACIDVTGVSARNRISQMREVARICGCSRDPRFLLLVAYKWLRGQAKRAWLAVRPEKRCRK